MIYQIIIIALLLITIIVLCYNYHKINSDKQKLIELYYNNGDFEHQNFGDENLTELLFSSVYVDISKIAQNIRIENPTLYVLSGKYYRYSRKNNRKLLMTIQKDIQYLQDNDNLSITENERNNLILGLTARYDTRLWRLKHNIFAKIILFAQKKR